MDSTFWSPGEPNEISKNCLKLAADSSDKVWWQDENCDIDLPYICHIGEFIKVIALPCVITSSRLKHCPIPTFGSLYI